MIKIINYKQREKDKKKIPHFNIQPRLNIKVIIAIYIYVYR